MPIIGEQCDTHTTVSKVEERFEGAASSTGGDLIQNDLEYGQSRNGAGSVLVKEMTVTGPMCPVWK